MKRIYILAAMFLFWGTMEAQQFGGNPSSIRWRQVNTDTVRVIFPPGLEPKAQRVVNVVHALQRNYSHTIGDTIRKVNIVLQNLGLISNAYVGLAPYRSEFYLTPPPNAFELGAVNWADNLAIHEFRHVQQYSNFNKGLSRVASFFLGEQGQALANAASIPDWFFEGDAVFNETRLTGQGRGALPLFISSYKSLFNAGRNYSYLTMRNGSLRKYVPDHYDLGYLLVAYGRIQYGNDIWHYVTDDAARFKPFFYPFQGAVKKYTGIPFHDYVKNAMTFYHRQWKEDTSEQVNWLTGTRKNDVVNYKYPYAASDGSLIVLKNSYREVPAFYRIYADRRAEKIAVKNISVDDHFSYNNGRIIYTSYQPDARWSNREFTTITVVNTTNGEETRIAPHARFFSPDISHNGESVTAVDMQPSGGSSLTVMDLLGKLSYSLPKADIIFSDPKFSADDRYVYAAERNDKGEMALKKYSLNDKGAVETLLPFANRIIGHLTVQGDTLLYSGTNNGRDEVWAYIDSHTGNGSYRLASYSTGLYQAALQQGRLVSSAFTADGYRLATYQPSWEKMAAASQMSDLNVGNVFSPEDHLLLNTIDYRTYPVTKYAKTFRLLNIHSYRPFYEAPEYSFTLYGENILNTLRTEIAYTYNQNEASHKVSYNGIYGGTYLQPLFGIAQNWHRTGLLGHDSLVNWNETVGYAGLQLPLNLSGGKQYRYLNLSTTINTQRMQWTGIGRKLFADRDINYLNVRLQYTGQVQKAVQYIYPHWAQTILLQYRQVVNGYTARQFLASGFLYLPGLSMNHNIVLTAAVHSRDTLQQYLFSNNFPFSRGYHAVDFPEMWRIGVNYHLPVAYPDKGFGGIVYFLRVRSNLFFDYTQGKSLRTGNVTPFRTAGTELFFDTKWWNQQPVTLGIRYSRLLDNEFRGDSRQGVWEIILPVNLFN